jgi:hypothetical protein
VTDKKKPGSRPALTVKGKGGQSGPVADGKPAPKKLAAPPRPKGPAFTAPKSPSRRKDLFWMCQRNTGRRPVKRHDSLESATEEARRLAENNPLALVWVYECRTVAEVKAGKGAGPQDEPGSKDGAP